MATKTVAVQLVALTQQYRSEMAKATASTQKTAVSAKAAQGSVSGLGTVAGLVGPQLAVGAAVGAAAIVKLGYDFDTAFSRITAVTNASQEQVGKWREQVLELSGRTAIAPRELAEGLYFLASAGLDTSEVFPALEASAKGAAIGMGEMGDVTRIVANVLNAYPDAGLKATDVLDVLTAALREGTAEPEEFAEALGRILPIASKAGISIDQIAGSLAALSNIGLDVNEGVTAMRGLLNALEAPGTQAANTIEAVGLSAEQLRRSLAEDGLVATLRLLEDATNGNIDVMRKIVPNVRALTGVFGLTGQEAAKVDGIFRAVADSSGSLGDSFRKTGGTDSFQLRQALNDLVVAATDLGQDVLPAVADALQLIADVTGPVLQLWRDWADVADGLGRELSEMPSEGLGILGELLDFNGGGASEAELDRISRATRELKANMDDLARSVATGKLGADEAWKSFLRMSDEAGVNPGVYREDFDALISTYEHTRFTSDELTDSQKRQGRAVRQAGHEAKVAARETREYRAALLELAGGTLGIVNQIRTINELQRDRNDLEKRGKRNSEEYRQNTLDLTEANLSLREMVRDYVADLKESGATQGDVRRKLRELAAQMGITREEFADALGPLGRVLGILQGINRVPKDQTFHVTTIFDQQGTGFDPRQQHAGGLAGTGARRLHAGGVNLRSDELMAVLQRGEGVLSRSVMQSVRQLVGAPTTTTTDRGSISNTIVVRLGEREMGRFVIDAFTGEVSRLVSR